MEIVTTRKLKFKVAGRTFETMGGGNIQAAPDWIIHDDLFHGAKSKGFLTVFNRGPVVKAEKFPEPQEATKAEPEALQPETTQEEKPRRGRRRVTEEASE